MNRAVYTVICHNAVERYGFISVDVFSTFAGATKQIEKLMAETTGNGYAIVSKDYDDYENLVYWKSDDDYECFLRQEEIQD